MSCSNYFDNLLQNYFEIWTVVQAHHVLYNMYMLVAGLFYTKNKQNIFVKFYRSDVPPHGL